MEFRKELTSFAPEHVRLITDLIFNKGVTSNEEIIRTAYGKCMGKEESKEILNILWVKGFISYGTQNMLGDMTIEPVRNSLDTLTSNGLYEPNKQ